MVQTSQNAVFLIFVHRCLFYSIVLPLLILATLLLGGLAVLFEPAATVISLVLVGVPAYFLISCRVLSRRKLVAAWAAFGLTMAGILCCPPVVHDCQFSYEARTQIAGKLSQDEARTLSCLPTEDKPSCFCTNHFQFRRNGKLVSVDAYEDIIHGTKIFYDPEGDR